MSFGFANWISKDKGKIITIFFGFYFNKINFFALSWTVVHPITNESPFKNLTSKDIEEMDVEIIILVKAFDDTFSQTVYSRNSYKYDEFVWNAKFNSSIFEEDGKMMIDLDKIDDYIILE